MRNLIRYAAAVAIALSLAACTTIASGVADIATNLSSSTPAQVTTLGQADLAADAVVNLSKAAVDTNKLNAGQLNEIQALRAGVRAALDRLHADNDAGRGLDYSIFNAALDAWRAYTTKQGIPN